MVGIVGFTKLKTPSTTDRIKKMAESIKTNNSQIIRYFSHKFLEVASVTYPELASSEYSTNEDGSIGALIYGRIFGYQEELDALKRRGHKIQDESNIAEFIIHSYEEYGKNAFATLNGSFCLVVFCTENPRLLLVTDRFGTRPLYYAFGNHELIFSSHSRAILAYPFPKKLNEKTLVKFLYFGKIGILGDETWFEGIKLMPSSSILTFTENGFNVEKYWDLEYLANPRDKKEIVGDLLKAFKKAVNIRVKDLNGVSVLLSGGLDSRSVLGAIDKKQLNEITAVTFGVSKCDDITVAKNVTRELCVKHLVIEYTPDELAEFAKDVVTLTEGQDTVNVSYIPFVANLMREKGIRYHLQGYMFDLLLGGSFLSKEFFRIKSYSEFLQALERKYSLFQPSELKKLLAEKLHKYIPSARKELAKLAYEAKGDSFPNKADYFAINTRVRRYTLMGSVLFREFIEELLPTIDNDVIKIISQIPPRLRFNYFVYREFLLALNRELAKIPYQKTLLPPILPTRLWRLSFVVWLLKQIIDRISRGKIRYTHTYFNFSEILRTSPAWTKLLKESLMSESSLIYKLGYLNKSYISILVNEHLVGRKDNGEKLAFLISLELFLQSFFLNESFGGKI